MAVVWRFFSLCSPECPKQPRIDNSYHRFLYPMICSTIPGVGRLYRKLHTATVDKLLCMKNADTQWSMVSYLKKKINKEYHIHTRKNPGIFET